MDRRLAVALVISVVAGCLATALATQVRLELTEILIPKSAWLGELAMLTLALVVLFVAHVIVYTLINKKTVRLALALVMVVVLSTTPLFGGTAFATLVLISAALGILIAQIGNYEGIWGLWGFLGKARGSGALILFILVLLIAFSDPHPFRESFKRSLVTFALSQAVPGASMEDVLDKMFPETVTEKEMQHLRNALRTQYPDFDALPPDVQRRLEENMIESYLQIKREIKAALRESLGRVDPETFAKQIEEFVQSMPLFQKIVEYAGALYALTVSFVYTLLSWLALIFAFLLGIMVWRKPKSGKVDKELAG